MGKAVQAKDTFIIGYQGADVRIDAGDILDSDHEIVRNTPDDWWADLAFRFPVEEATAKPGVKRATKAKSAAK